MIKTNYFLELHVGEDDGFFQLCSSDTVGIKGVKAKTISASKTNN